MKHEIGSFDDQIMLKDVSLSSCRQKIKWLEKVNADLLKACKQAEQVIFGPMGDLLSGDSMNDTGAYDVLDIIRQAISRAEGK